MLHHVIKAALATIVLATTFPASAAGDARMEKAAAKGQVSVIQDLLGAGVDINARYDIGRTALMIAAQKRRTAAVDVLLDSGADPNLQDANGETALMLATLEADLTIVKLLIRRGANPAVRTRNGRTALDYAKRFQRHETRLVPVVEYLSSNEVERMAFRVPGAAPAASAAVAARRPDVSGPAQLVNVILVDLSARNPPVEQIRASASRVLANRGWRLEKTSDPDYLQGSITRRDNVYRAGIRIYGTRAEIGYVSGYEKSGDSWLRNLQRDLMADFSVPVVSRQ
jgi:hypothetical protein